MVFFVYETIKNIEMTGVMYLYIYAQIDCKNLHFYDHFFNILKLVFTQKKKKFVNVSF